MVDGAGFGGQVHDYETLVRQAFTAASGAWLELPCVSPGRDDTPVSAGAPLVWRGASPGAFQAWLEAARDRVQREAKPSERLVFIDAWNDWERGRVLAPDLRFGHAWLEAVANAADAALLEP